MSHILVTGANGFIGSHLVRKLLEIREKEKSTEEILCLVRSTACLTSLKGLDVKLVIGDLCKPGTLIKAVKGASVIYHLGAELYATSRQAFLEANAHGTRNLMETAAAHAKGTLKRFVLVSSQAAAGPAPGPEPITEEAEFSAPVSWYAESKQEAEKIAAGFMKQIPVTIVRPCSVYGEGDIASTSIFRAAAARIHALTGFRKRYTGMVYARDLVEGIIAAAKSAKAVGQTYFLCNPRSYTVREMVKTVARGIGRPFGITIPVPLFIFRIAAFFSEIFYLFFRGTPIPTQDKVRDISQVYWLCTPEKAKRDFAWEAGTSLLDGAKATYEYMKAEDRRVREMTGESAAALWLKYFILGLAAGVIVEVICAVINLYHFSPWWIAIIAVVGLWGLIYGTLGKIMRTCGVVLQFLVGFSILFAAELLNTYFLHLWEFNTDIISSIGSPLVRAVILGISAGIVIPIMNAVMRQVYRRRMRLG